MNSFYQLIKKIEKRPSVYIGKKSIFNLQAFLDGYYFARRELNIPLTEEEKEFQNFLQWIREKFNIETGQLWSSIILFQAGDETRALNRFFSLFNQFIAETSENLNTKVKTNVMS